MYHPNKEINEEVAADAMEAEIYDVMIAGYPPRRWTCDCGASHARGFFMTPGVHRCLGCGYYGPGGTLE